MLALVRSFLQAVVRFFYPAIVVSEAQRLPAEGPVLIVSNHPNGLVDPVVLGIALGRPVAFLAKSTFFEMPIAKLAMDAFGAIAIFRAVDGASTLKNDETFARCREMLRGKGWIAIFPEGTTHSEPSLKPLKTGAARIALSALAEGGPGFGLSVLPMGLLYEDKEIFRSRVAVSVGDPIDVTAHMEDYGRDPRATAETVTGQIDAALSRVVLEAETQELWRGFVAVAAWTSPEAARDLALHEARARELSRAWRALAASDPQRAGEILAFARRFVRMLRAVGIRDPLSLDDPTAPGLGATVGSLLPLVVFAPVALLGAILGWGPYRLVRPIALKAVGDKTELTGTFKLLLGLFIMTLTYAVEAIAAGAWLGWPAGLATLVVGPLTGYVALRFGEKVDLRRRALRAVWLRARRAKFAEQIRARRRELARMVETELGRAPRT